jgi:hypothetical protein
VIQVFTVQFLGMTDLEAAEKEYEGSNEFHVARIIKKRDDPLIVSSLI